MADNSQKIKDESREGVTTVIDNRKLKKEEPVKPGNGEPENRKTGKE